MSQKIAIYGKGGAGKSTIAAALSSCFADRGLRVLHMGCDPKADSCRLLVPQARTVSVMGTVARTDQYDASSLLMQGVKSITCIEAGGPEPGVGCAGRGISRTFEILDELGVSIDGYDVVIYDVLGDVVCGGFATPLKSGHADQVVVVASGSAMSLFAANNILRAVKRFQRNGVRLAGLVGNYLTGQPHAERLRRFAALAQTRVLADLPLDPDIALAEQGRQTICDFRPEGKSTAILRGLADRLLAPTAPKAPRPLDEAAFEGLIALGRDGQEPGLS